MPAEGSNTHLGQHSQTFESHTPDQTLPNRAKEHQKAVKSIGFSLPFFSIFCNPKCENISNTLNPVFYLFCVDSLQRVLLDIRADIVTLQVEILVLKQFSSSN